MAQIVTCPHCGKLERYKGAAHTHCTFCRAALSGPVPGANRGGERSGNQQRDAVLRMTVFGGLWGGGIAAALAFLFYGLALILVSFAPAEFGVDKTPFIVGQLIRLVVLPTCIGIAEGALLMAVATALLQRYGRLLWTTSLGAIVGALVGPGLIGFLVVLPAVLAQTSAPDHSARFVLCLVAAAIGAPLGMAAMFVLTAAVMAIETTQKPNA